MFRVILQGLIELKQALVFTHPGICPNLQKKYALLKTILLFGAGKSATVLIEFLLRQSEKEDWRIIIADAVKERVEEKTKQHPKSVALGLDITDDKLRRQYIQEADVVISMMPPALHYLIARDCVQFGRHLLTASYVDEQIKELAPTLREKGILFLCEMGLDPGIDHMSAMKIIDEIKSNGGIVKSFKSHCGGLVSPESDDNPWHYKISWNPRNVVLAGAAGAEYKEEKNLKKIAYTQIFNLANQVMVPGLGMLAFYPNRDSLAYIPIYGLQDADTFMRTTLRYPAFIHEWNHIVQAHLTDDTRGIDSLNLSFEKWSAPILPFITNENKDMFQFLGFFETSQVPGQAKTSADILQFLLESRLAMQPLDKDMIVMLHEFEYEINRVSRHLQSSLIVKGKDALHTAMAKTVGLPLGIAATLILKGKLNVTGLHIPIIKEIYEPVLKSLEMEGIQFTETTI